MSRRRFIFLGLLSLITALFGSFYFYDFDTVLFKIIKKDLAYLKLSNQQIETFVLDAKKENHWERKFFDWKKQYFMRVGFMIVSFWNSFPYYYKYNQYKSELVGDFLLSTDFFMNRMDVDADITYVALYNPYKRACSNPFSNLYYPGA
ncbi:hypothetical protein [Fulvivirga sp.]|uniref:hypothetical protein n=1 Tax=Fulvivirga sp. TaxID=1931237 RepID=UPI0032EAF8C3